MDITTRVNALITFIKASNEATLSSIEKSFASNLNYVVPVDLAVPTALRAWYKGDNDTELDWTNVSGAKGYIINFSADQGKTWVQIANVVDNGRYFKHNPSPFGINYYEIKAYNDTTTSAFSPVVIFEMKKGNGTVPTPPTPTPTDPIAGYTKIAAEGETHDFGSQVVDVAYGANGKYNFKTGLTGKVVFSNTTFSDPIVGIRKSGYYKTSTVVPTPVPGTITDVYAPFSLHVEAKGTEPKSWDNGTKGYNTAYFAGTPGSYVFNGINYNVVASNRKRIVLNDDSMPATVGDNTDLILIPGKTYRAALPNGTTVMSNATIQVDNWFTDKKTSTIISPQGSGSVIGLKGNDTAVIGVSFDSDYKEANEKLAWDAIRPYGKRSAIVGCTFVNVTCGFIMEWAPEDTFISDCHAPNATSVRAYFTWVAGKNTVIHNCTCPNSTIEHCIRTGGPIGLQIYNCNMSQQEAVTSGSAGDIIKSVYNIQWAYRAYLQDCKGFGPCSVGPLGVDPAPSAVIKAQRAQDIVFDNLWIEGALNIRHGTTNCKMINCKGSSISGYFFMVDGYSSLFDRRVENLVIQDCDVTGGISGKGPDGKGYSNFYPTQDVASTTPTGFISVGAGSRDIALVNNKLSSKFMRQGGWGSPATLSLATGVLGFSLNNNSFGNPLVCKLDGGYATLDKLLAAIK